MPPIAYIDLHTIPTPITQCQNPSIHGHLQKTEDRKLTTGSGASFCLHITQGTPAPSPTAIWPAHCTYLSPSPCSRYASWTVLYSFSICIISEKEIRRWWIIKIVRSFGQILTSHTDLSKYDGPSLRSKQLLLFHQIYYHSAVFFHVILQKTKQKKWDFVQLDVYCELVIIIFCKCRCSLSEITMYDAL